MKNTSKQILLFPIVFVLLTIQALWFYHQQNAPSKYRTSTERVEQIR